MELNLQTKMDVAETLKASGRSLCLDDLPDVIELNQFAEKVSNPKAESSVALSLLPVRVANVNLYPPKIAGLIWHDEHLTWWTGADYMPQLVLAFICSTEDQAGLVKTLNTQADALAAIRAWGRGVNASLIELITAIDKLMPTGDGTGDGDSWPVVSLLCREYGCTPRYWIDESPISEIVCLLDEYGARQDRELLAMKRAAKGRWSETLSADKAHAIKAYREKLNSIKKKWGVTNG